MPTNWSYDEPALGGNSSVYQTPANTSIMIMKDLDISVALVLSKYLS